MNIIRMLLFSFLLSSPLILRAQDSVNTCKVLLESIKGEYTGECKKGLAHGKGESKGIFRYAGDFKYGLPNGKGILYSGSNFFDGTFQNGIKEGKGEMHFIRINNTDSIIKGYWSGDEFRGKSYKTYQTDAISKFDHVEVSPTSGAGSRITVEISTTSRDLDSPTYNPRVSVVLTELISVKLRSLIKLLSTSESANKSTWTFEITEFPITLRGELSNGQNFNLDLYKSADWMFRIFINK